MKDDKRDDVRQFQVGDGRCLCRTVGDGGKRRKTQGDGEDGGGLQMTTGDDEGRRGTTQCHPSSSYPLTDGHPRCEHWKNPYDICVYSLLV